MDIREFINQMKKINKHFLDYIDGDENEEENYQNLIDLLKDSNFTSNKQDLKIILCLIYTIANNHHRCNNFFEKIEKIFLIIKTQITYFFTKDELFDLFRKNKRILLFLVNEKIITIDKGIYLKIPNKGNQINDYKFYFYPEINQQSMSEMPDDFNDKRKIGENDNILCQIIQKDQIEEFIIYINKENCSLTSAIPQSHYETNPFLLKNIDTTMIEYAAFFGAVQIFKYLSKNNVQLEPTLWLYAIHGDDAEIINILEENKVEPPDGSFNKCIKECFKCHHNHIFKYIEMNLTNVNYEDVDITKDFYYNIYSNSFQYYNFLCVPEQKINDNLFYYACEFGYLSLVEYFLKNSKIDINAKIILNTLYCY